ncbi:Oidioi.mRNA.OKI2018_I69.PAR.g12455.t1.cds [Oikopleura dioica]|uniref:Oidioi.mRNA.OKI2018_I69.PAR.g12455.t1.cds n=1 Tax=Oikopleura dioica TaxID=34765 RepID=A0ABN7S6I5_OIKDI|nr:Oidioi.mRNA.OKI2018_I69.PAR.g12455.t1.cds [Oikopleura dioica]
MRSEQEQKQSWIDQYNQLASWAQEVQAQMQHKDSKISELADELQSRSTSRNTSIQMDSASAAELEEQLTGTRRDIEGFRKLLDMAKEREGNLKNELNKLVEKLEDAEEKISNMEEIKNELAQRKEEINDLNHQKMILEGILKNEQAEIERSNEQLLELNEEIEDYQRKVEQLEADRAVLTQENDHHSDNVLEINGKLEEMNATVARLRELLEQAQDEANLFKRKSQEYEEEYEIATQKLKEIETEKAEKHNQIGQLIQALKASQTEVSQAKDNERLHSEKISVLSSEITELRQQLASLEEELKQKQNLLSEAKHQCQIKDDLLQSSSSQISSEREDRLKLSVAQAHAEERVKTLTEEIDDLQGKLTEVGEALVQSNLEVSRLLQENIRVKEESARELQQSDKNAQVRLESLKKELELARDQLEQLQKMSAKEKSNQNNELQSLQGEIATREAQFEFEKKQAKIEFESEIQKLTLQISNLQSQRENFEASIARSSEKIESLELLLSQHARSLEDQQIDSSSQIEKITLKLSQKSAEMAELEENHVQVKNKSKKLLLSQKQLLTENKQLKDKVSSLTKMQQDSIAASSSVNEEKSALLSQNSEYSEVIRSQTEQLAALSTQYTEMESSKCALEKQKSKLDEELALVFERLKMGESQLLELSEKCKIYENTNAQLQSSFDADSAQRDEEKSNLLGQISLLKQENEENRRQIHAIQQERDSTVSKMRQEIEQLHLVSYESKELADRLGVLENQLQAQTSKMELEKNDFEKTRQELEVRVQTLTLQNEELLKSQQPSSTPVDPVLQSKLIELQSQNQFFEGKINELTDLIDSQKAQISYINDEKNNIQDELAQLSAAKAAADQLLSSQHAEIVRLSDEQTENAEFMDERELLTRKLAEQNDILVKLQYAITSEIGQDLQSDSSFRDDPSSPIIDRIQAAISAYFRHQQNTTIELESATESLKKLTLERDRIQKEYREVSEQLVDLQKERESSGGQFIPSQRDYFYSESSQGNQGDAGFSEALEEAIHHERQKFIGEKESLQHRVKSLEAQVNNLENLLEEADKEQSRNQSQNQSYSNNIHYEQQKQENINSNNNNFYSHQEPQENNNKNQPEEIQSFRGFEDAPSSNFFTPDTNPELKDNQFDSFEEQDTSTVQSFFKPTDEPPQEIAPTQQPTDSFAETTAEQPNFFTPNVDSSHQETQQFESSHAPAQTVFTPAENVKKELQGSSFFTPNVEEPSMPAFSQAPETVENSFFPSQSENNTGNFFVPNSSDQDKLNNNFIQEPAAAQFHPVTDSFHENQNTPSFFTPTMETPPSVQPTEPPSFFVPNSAQEPAAPPPQENFSGFLSFPEEQTSQDQMSFFKPNVEQSFDAQGQNQSSAFDSFSESTPQNSNSMVEEESSFSSASKFFS